jgi:pimeloyl-ACP methyl ester carboxylesterase
LHVARFRSSASSNGNATLFLQGGPGTYVQSELSTLTPERLRALTANGDLIVFDQRGAGTATPSLECEAVGRAATGPDRTRAFTACVEQYRSANIDVRAYDSEHIARDIEALRRALGLTQLNLVARSYGTRVALEVLRRYESAVRAVVLDAPVAPDIATWAEQARNFEAGLRALSAECAQTEACNGRYPAIDQQLLTAAQQLDAQPLSVDLGFAVIALDGAAMLGAVDLALYRRETYPALPLIIDAARRRDAATLSATRREFVNPMTVSNAGASLGMNQVVTCNDSVQYFDDGAVAQAESGVHPRIRQHFYSLYVRVVRDACTATRPVMRAGVTQPVRSSVPTLLLSGAIDPTVHTSYAPHVAATLSRSASFTFARVGHGAFETPCGSALTERFLASADPNIDGSCATQTPAINFR